MSRPTVMAHLDALEIAHAITRLPPYHGGGHREIVRQRRVYAFDTGLVAHVRGWQRIRESDRGLLWEHLVLDELLAMKPAQTIHYWRDKSQREIDFVIENKDGVIDTLEAKINPDAFDAASLRVFREMYPQGRNFLICPHVAEPYTIRRAGLRVRVCSVWQI